MHAAATHSHSKTCQSISLLRFLCCANSPTGHATNLLRVSGFGRCRRRKFETLGSPSCRNRRTQPGSTHKTRSQLLLKTLGEAPSPRTCLPRSIACTPAQISRHKEIGMSRKPTPWVERSCKDMRNQLETLRNVLISYWWRVNGIHDSTFFMYQSQVYTFKKLLH